MYICSRFGGYLPIHWGAGALLCGSIVEGHVGLLLTPQNWAKKNVFLQFEDHLGILAPQTKLVGAPAVVLQEPALTFGVVNKSAPSHKYKYMQKYA